MAIVAAGTVGSFFANSVHAAADEDFASSTAGLLTIFSDNKGTIWIIIGAVIGIALLLGLGIRALLFGKNQIISAVPGGSKKGKR